MSHPHIWEIHEIDTHEPHFGPRDLSEFGDDLQTGLAWHDVNVTSQDTTTERLDESVLALNIDDSEERKEIAALAGLRSVPRREISNIDQFIGLFDDLAVSHKEIDVTAAIRLMRKRSTR